MKFIIINVSVICCLLVKSVHSQCQIAETCVTDLTVADCAPGQVLGPHLTIYGCCPGCQMPTGYNRTVPFRAEPISNITDLSEVACYSIHSLQSPTTVSGKGLITLKWRKCLVIGGGVITEGCQAPSSCLPDGKYAPVQCKGDLFTGRCFCSDENGKRIFGQMWRNEASEMTCACSRRRAELEASGRKVVSLHCTSTGDYEPLQCDDGMCWCAEPKTGQPTVTPVLEVDMKILPCYSAGVVGEQYLRKCESLVQSLAAIHQEQSEHGTNFLGNPTSFCDYDGSYGPYQIQNGIAYCTGRDGEILGSWQIMSSEMSGMNCNCARDTMMYFPKRGMTVTEICLANGNYQPNQNVGDVYYCVDTDGYNTTELLEEWPTDRCASFA